MHSPPHIQPATAPVLTPNQVSEASRSANAKVAGVGAAGLASLVHPLGGGDYLRRSRSLSPFGMARSVPFNLLQVNSSEGATQSSSITCSLIVLTELFSDHHRHTSPHHSNFKSVALRVRGQGCSPGRCGVYGFPLRILYLDPWWTATVLLISCRPCSRSLSPTVYWGTRYSSPRSVSTGYRPRHRHMPPLGAYFSQVQSSRPMLNLLDLC
eukprot:SAG11_NODE_361_length_10183_cov_4.077053_7_plen_211_part_00